MSELWKDLFTNMAFQASYSGTMNVKSKRLLEEIEKNEYESDNRAVSAHNDTKQSNRFYSGIKNINA